MMRTLTTHWLLQVIVHRVVARSWIDCGNRGSNAVTSREEAAQRARTCLRYSRQAAEHFKSCIREWRRRAGL